MEEAIISSVKQATAGQDKYGSERKMFHAEDKKKNNRSVRPRDGIEKENGKVTGGGGACRKKGGVAAPMKNGKGQTRDSNSKRGAATAWEAWSTFGRRGQRIGGSILIIYLIELL